MSTLLLWPFFRGRYSAFPGLWSITTKSVCRRRTGGGRHATNPIMYRPCGKTQARVLLFDQARERPAREHGLLTPQINYASDKGWGAALEEFCLALAEGRRPANAGPADGNRATACAAAARRSIVTGEAVALGSCSDGRGE